MPFCRKCGRQLAPYTKKCSDCGTATDGPLTKFTKISTAASRYKANAKTKVAKDVESTRVITVSFKTFSSTKHVKATSTNKTDSLSERKGFTPLIAAPRQKAVIYHEIKQSNTSVEEDIITNPKDYETQIFSFDLECPFNHFWPKGKALPISKGKVYCPKCGEQIKASTRKDKVKKEDSFKK